MIALSIRPPWPWAILHFPADDTLPAKRVENRLFRRLDVVGQRIAIHASKTSDDRGYQHIRSLGVQVSSSDVDHHPGCVVGSAVVAGYVSRASELPFGQEPWYVGERYADGRANYGWILEDVRPLGCALSCRGMLGLWKVPDWVEAAVLADLRRTP